LMTVIADVLRTEAVSISSLPESSYSQRLALIQEIYKVEQQYLENLNICVNYYVDPFIAAQHGGRKILRLFIQLKQLTSLHANIIASLPNPPQNTDVIFLCTVFSLALPTMKNLYSAYYLHYFNNMSLLHESLMYNYDFTDYAAKNRDESRGKDISWLLRLPIQRLAQYEYLFEKLSHHVTGNWSLEATAIHTLLLSIREMNFTIENQLFQEDSSRKKDLEESGFGGIGWSIPNIFQQFEGWNVIVLGADESREKTQLIHSMIHLVQPLECPTAQPLEFKNYVFSHIIGPPSVPENQEIFLRMWDSTGLERYPFMRTLQYPRADIVWICFSIKSPEQFNNIVPLWYKEIKLYCKHVPWIMVGYHCEARNDPAAVNLVSSEEALVLADLLGVKYVECSFTTGEGLVNLATETATHTVVKYVKEHKNDPRERILSGILDEHLDLSYQTNMVELPQEIRYCTNMTSLDLSNNGLQVVPSELFSITRLTKLNLSNNLLTDVNGIEQLTNLQELNLADNKLNFLPAGLGHCSKLMILDLQNNPLDTLPKDIFSKKSFNEFRSTKERNQLYAYLRSIQERGQAAHYRVKLMLLGDKNVGKTSLLQSFQLSNSRSRSSSISSRHVTKDVGKITSPRESTNISVTEVLWYDKEQAIYWDCWDYSGSSQAIKQSHHFFLTPGAVYLVCFNLLNRDYSQIEYWLNSIHDRAKGAPIVLVGTHADDPQCTPQYVTNFLLDIKDRYSSRFKNDIGVTVIKHLVALTTKGRRHDEIRNLMDTIGSIVLKNRLVGNTYPNSWLGLEQHFRSAEHAQPFMSWNDFTKIAEKCYISSEDVDEAAAFLHNSGVISRYTDNTQLHSPISDFVILDAQFLISSIVSVISASENKIILPGEFVDSQVPLIWKDYPEILHPAILALMEKFDIAFLLPKPRDGVKKFVIPWLLPESQPEIVNQLWNQLDSHSYQLGRIYKFKFLPHGFARTFVQLLHLPKVSSLAYWQLGILISNEEEMALIRYNPTKYKLTLNVRGEKDSPSRGQFLRLIIESVATMIESWSETELEILIPCTHCIEANSYDPFLFKVEECIQQVTSGNAFVLCSGVRKVRIDALAPDISFGDMQTKRIDFNDIHRKDIIGTGAFGRVYEGLWNETKVALKILENSKESPFSECDPSDDEGFKIFNQFQREVWIMSCIRHRNLVQLLGVCTNPPAMVMELLPMSDLYQILYPKDPPSEVEIAEKPKSLQKYQLLQTWHAQLVSNLELRIRIALDIAEGMKYLHSLSPPIIHRDLRSPNIFLLNLSPDAKTVAKVGDFGLSRQAAMLQGGNFNDNWLAPEVMKEIPYTEKVDIYSYGIILYELISLVCPFTEYDHIYHGKPPEKFKKDVIAGLRPTIPDDCPGSYRSLIEDCWQENPEKRPSFTDIVPRVIAILGELGFRTDFESHDMLYQASLRELPMPKTRTKSTEVLQEKQYFEFTGHLSPPNSGSVQCLLVVNNSVWAGCRTGMITKWNKESGEKITEFCIHASGIYTMEIVFGYVWTAFEDGSIIAIPIDHDPDRGKKLVKIQRERQDGACVRSLVALRDLSDLSATSKHVRVVSGDTRGSVIIWKVNKRSPKRVQKDRQLASFDSVVYCIRQDNIDSNHIWLGLINFIVVLDWRHGTTVAKFQAHAGSVNEFASFGQYVWTCGNDNSVCVWDARKCQSYVENNTPENKIVAHSGRVFTIERVGNLIASGSFDMSIIFYDAVTRQVVQESRQHKDGVRSLVAISDNILWSGSMSRDATIGVWKKS